MSFDFQASGKRRDASLVKRAREMHDECMKDPEYAARWNDLVARLAGLLPDLPASAGGDADL